MQKLVSIFLLALMCLAVFKSATPFLSYKANYEYIFKEVCENRGTDKHDDCDGFCYLKKKIHEHDGHSDEQSHSGKAIQTNLYSSIYGLMEPGITILSPFRSSKKIISGYLISDYEVYPELVSPPPQS